MDCDDLLWLDLAEHGDLIRSSLLKRNVATTGDKVWAETCRAGILDGGLGWLGLLLALDDWHEGDVDLKEVILSCSAAKLAHSLDKWCGLNIANGSSELDNADVWGLMGVVDWDLSDALDPVLDRVRQVWHDLNGAAEVVSATLFLDYVLVDLAGCDVVLAREGDVEVALVVTKIEVDFSAVVENEDFTVPGVLLVPIQLNVTNTAACAEWCFEGYSLSWSHGTGIDVHIWIDLDASDLQSDSLEQQAGGRGYTSHNQPLFILTPHSPRLTVGGFRACGTNLLTNNALSNARNDTSRNQNVLHLGGSLDGSVEGRNFNYARPGYTRRGEEKEARQPRFQNYFVRWWGCLRLATEAKPYRG